MQGADRYIVVRALDLRLEIAGSIPAAALLSRPTYNHIHVSHYQMIKTIVLNRIKACQ